MTDKEKKLVSGENLSSYEKAEIKSMLEDMANNIKSKEEISWINVELDEKILSLSGRVDELQTKEELNDFLNDLDTELAVLKEYQAFKELLAKLEQKVDNLRKKVIWNTKKELWNFAQKICFDTKDPNVLYQMADIWRKNAVKEIEQWIVVKLAQRDDWIGRLAKKALW